MALDPNIALQARSIQLENPVDVQLKQLQLRSLLGQQRTQDMQYQQAQRQQQQDDDYAQALRNGVGADGRLDYGGTLGALARSGNARGYGTLLKQQTDATKAQADLGHVNAQTADLDVKTKAARMSYVQDSIKRMLSNPNLTTDDAIRELAQSPPEMREQAAQLARNLSPDPRQLRQQLLTLGLNAEQHLKALTPQLQAMNLGGTEQLVDVNPMTRGGAPTSFKKTMTPGEAATDARAGQRLAFDKEQAAGGVTYQQDADGNVIALPSKATPGSIIRATQVAAPGAGLVPLQGKGAATEDQAKAAGWLAQADNAWKNMQKAITASPGSSTPGFSDALATVPGLGGIGNMMRGPERQKFNQAASSLSEALLRAATGAGVNKDEAKQKIEELTPVWGEDPETTKQKFAAVPIYLESLRTRAGPAARKSAQTANTDPLGMAGIVGAAAPSADASDPLGMRALMTRSK